MQSISEENINKAGYHPTTELVGILALIKIKIQHEPAVTL